MPRRLVAFGLLLSAAAARSQPPAPVPPPANPEIVVEGQKLDSRDIAAAVRAISNPEPTGGFESQYPRWADRICVLVGGFSRDGGQFIADRIGEVARSLKLDPGQPGCSPDIFILATDDPSKLIAELRIKRRGLVTGKDVAIVRRIQKSQDAVRWIGATTILGGAGEPAVPSAFGVAGRSAPELRSYDGGSRLAARTQVMLTRETVIVDTRQITGLSYGQLSDYLAFVTLAQLNPHAGAPGVDSILSLFPRGGTAPAGLTQFDKAYLKGLYQSASGDVGVLQKGAIEATIDKQFHPKESKTASTPAPPGP